MINSEDWALKVILMKYGVWLVHNVFIYAWFNSPWHYCRNCSSNCCWSQVMWAIVLAVWTSTNKTGPPFPQLWSYQLPGSVPPKMAWSPVLWVEMRNFLRTVQLLLEKLWLVCKKILKYAELMMYNVNICKPKNISPALIHLWWLIKSRICFSDGFWVFCSDTKHGGMKFVQESFYGMHTKNLRFETWKVWNQKKIIKKTRWTIIRKSAEIGGSPLVFPSRTKALLLDNPGLWAQKRIVEWWNGQGIWDVHLYHGYLMIFI